MNPAHFFAPELIREIDIPQRGIFSRAPYDNNDVKLLYFLEGQADLTLGAEAQAVKAGAFAHTPPDLNYAILAETPLVMLLLMIKGLKRQKGRPGRRLNERYDRTGREKACVDTSRKGLIGKAVS